MGQHPGERHRARRHAPAGRLVAQFVDCIEACRGQLVALGPQGQPGSGRGRSATTLLSRERTTRRRRERCHSQVMLLAKKKEIPLVVAVKEIVFVLYPLESGAVLAARSRREDSRREGLRSTRPRRKCAT